MPYRLAVLIGMIAYVALASASSSFSENVTYDEIHDYLVAHPQLTKLEALLPLLPESYRSAYTLMHASGSKQGATPDNPRAILYGRDARLLMAFNGSPDQEGFDTLEMIQFRDQGARFEFHRLTFTAQGIQYSKANPRECGGCHGGDDPRPNWEHYSRWPGAYGADHDNVHDDTPELPAALRTLIARAPQDARYQNLVNLREGYSQPGGTTWQQHNEDLNQRIAMLNLRRVSRLLRALPSYPQVKYALAGLLECRRELETFLPDRQRAAFADFRSDVRHRVAALGSLNSTGADAIIPFLDRLGQKTDNWSTDFLSPYPGFTTPGVPDAEFLAFWVREDPDFAPYFRVDDDEYRGAYAPQAQFISSCEALRAASRSVWH